MQKIKVGICYSAYINQDCSPNDLSESILKVYNEFKDRNADLRFYVTIYDPNKQNAVSTISKLREDHNLSVRILIEPLDPAYKQYCTKGHAMCNGAVAAYIDGCDHIGFMDGDETIPDGKFPTMIDSINEFDADICFVEMPRSVFSGLVTNSFLVYYTCYLDYEVPGFISGYYLLNNQLAQKVFQIKNENEIKDALDSETDISPATFMRISDSVTSSVRNYRNWAIDTSIVVLSLVEHKAKCCSAKVTPKIDRSALSYSDVGVTTIENMFNQLIGGIAHMIATYKLNEKTAKRPQKPPSFGTFTQEIEHKPIDIEAYKQIVERYKGERKDEYEKILSVCPDYFEINSDIENIDKICKNHGNILKKLISELNDENHETLARSLVTACIHFMTLRVELLTQVVETKKDVVSYSDQIQNKVIESLI